MATMPRRTGAFEALRNPNYRLWFAGQTVSILGTWMQQTAQGFLIFELTRSPAYLGYLGFAAGAPTWLLTLYGGVIADRVPRRTLLLVTQTWMMTLAFLLAALAFTGAARPGHVLTLALLVGVANALEVPARQSFVAELVPREELTNAISLNAVMFNTGIAVGPGLAGVTYAVLGPAWCFALNGLSFFAVLAALLAIRVRIERPAREARSVAADLREALRYVAGHRVMRAIIGVMGATSLFGISVMTLMPAWAVNVLHGDARLNGWLFSVRGAGSLAGAFVIAARARTATRGRLLTIGTFAFPILTLAFAPIRHPGWALAAMLAAGFAFVFIVNLANALLQHLSPDHLRGRVMGVYSLFFFGLMPVGALLIGLEARYLGEPAAVAAGAAVGLSVAALVWLVAPDVRRTA
jgi:MFS family permease